MSTINRRELLGGTATVLGAGMLGAKQASAAQRPAAPTGAGKRPNLVLFFLDELRADALSCYGNPVTKTPNFDAFAKSGTRFANCHVQNPVCTQSRCSMLTGWPTSVRGHRSLYYLLQPDEPNMFRYLKDAGYDVYWFGKNDALAPQTFIDSVTTWHDADRQAEYAPLFKIGAKLLLPPTTMRYPGGEDRKITGDYALVQDAIKLLEQRDRDRPFCLFLPLSNPHPPYRAPDTFDTMYAPASLPPLVPPNLPDKPAYFKGIRDYYKLDQASDLDLRGVRAAYYGQVSFADWLLGEFLSALTRTGHDEDTAVIVSSDHGDYAGDYGLVEKWPSGLESCLTHVPLLARMPGGAKGHVVEEMVELFDIMATMLELGGTQATHTNFSRSLVAQLNGAAGDPKRAAFSEGGYNVYEPQAFEPRMPGPYAPKANLENDKPLTVQRAAAIKTRDFTFIARPHGQSELYDRRRDPMETRNLIDNAQHRRTLTDMQQRLLGWYVETTGVPPNIKDPRDTPPFTKTAVFPNAERLKQEMIDQ
jgi:choline-sulfatase